MLQMAQQLLAQNVNFTVAGELVKLAIKIFFSVCRLQMPASMQNPQALQAWLGMMNTALLKDVSACQSGRRTPTGREWSWWKVKKWVIKTWHTLFNSTATTTWRRTCSRSPFWSSQVAHHLLDSVMQNLQLRATAASAPTAASWWPALPEHSIELGSTFAVIASHLDALVFKLILPVSSEADMLLWSENPRECVRKGCDIAEEYLDPRDAARPSSPTWRGSARGSCFPFSCHTSRATSRLCRGAAAQLLRRKGGHLSAIGTCTST